ncbi:MAG: TM2 domain-containing protein [Thermosynechococcaceae cyanobacterium]
MVNNGTAYLLWLACFFGLSGIQRFYTGKPVSGILYLFTLGFFGIGQLLDLVLIPSMVDEKNIKYWALHGLPYQAAAPQVVVNVGEGYHAAIQKPPQLMEIDPKTERLDVTVLKVCRELGGGTISDCVIETGADPEEIKTIIHYLSVNGLLCVDNRETDGAIIYRAI